MLIYQPMEEDMKEVGLGRNRKYGRTAERREPFRLIMTHPPHTDRYYPYLKPLIDDYYLEVDRVSLEGKLPRAEGTLMYHIIVRKLAYFLHSPQLYGNSYYHFGISMMFGILMHMRQFVMRQRIMRGEMIAVWNKSLPRSNQDYQFPKPMGNKAMSLMASQIYDLFYEDAMREIRLRKKTSPSTG